MRCLRIFRSLPTAARPKLRRCSRHLARSCGTVHHEHLERREGRAICSIRVARHRFLERGANAGITAVLAETRHDAEDRVAPLAERDEVVEALEDDVLLAEMLTVAGIFEPIPGDRFLWIGDARDIVKPLVDPALEEVKKRPDRHVIVVYDGLRRVAEGKNCIEALADRANLREGLPRPSPRGAGPSRRPSSNQDSAA